MATTIRDTIDDFIKTELKYQQLNKEMVKNIFGLGIKGPAGYSLASQDAFKLYYEVSDEGIQSSFKKAIIASIKAYPKSKDSAILVYKKYIEYLKRKHGLEIDICFPPVPVSITLERQLYIAKLLHNPAIKISDLPKKLFVGERTIEDDLKKLRGLDDDPIQVMGQKLTVDFERNKSCVTFPSTVHPLFLTQNLTQIICMLKGLEHQQSDPALKSYALSTAVSVWRQLSDYAQDRIMTVSAGLGLDKSWFEKLDAMARGEAEPWLFRSEMGCSNSMGSGNVLYCLKNEKPCSLEYQEEDGSLQYYPNCMVRHYGSGWVEVLSDGEIIRLNLDQVTRSALTPEELI